MHDLPRPDQKLPLLILLRHSRFSKHLHTRATVAPLMELCCFSSGVAALDWNGNPLKEVSFPGCRLSRSSPSDEPIEESASTEDTIMSTFLPSSPTCLSNPGLFYVNHSTISVVLTREIPSIMIYISYIHGNLYPAILYAPTNVTD